MSKPKQTLEQLRRQEAEDKTAVEHTVRALQAAQYRLTLTQMRISDHKDYVPRKPGPFDNGQVHGLPVDLRRPACAEWLAVEDFNL